LSGEFRNETLHIPCTEIDEKIEEFLEGINIETELIPEIRKAYKFEIRNSASEERRTRLAELNRQLSELREEEARLGRLLITNMISEETYFQLRKEWQEKQRNITANIADLERETNLCLDDLDAAIILMTKMSRLYSRLSEIDRTKLLQIIIKQIIVNGEGKIIDYELNTPFAYLQDLVDLQLKLTKCSRGSDQIRVGAHTHKNRSSDEVERFVSLIRFQTRGKFTESRIRYNDERFQSI
jgi:hypothetical protein